jgi:hypothetical protein
MRGAGRIIIAIAAVIAVVLVVLFVVKVTQSPTLRPVAKIEFSQSAAEPNFDNSTFVVTDQKRIHEFGELVHHYGVNLDSFSSTGTAGCAGGTKTTATVVFVSGARQKFTLYSCGSNSAGGEFVTKATTLFENWRTSSS